MKSLTVTTGRWGDVVAPFHTPEGATQPDFADIASIIQKYGQVRAPLRASAELHPNLPNLDLPIDIRDIAAAVDAFTGQQYPYDGPTACP